MQNSYVKVGSKLLKALLTPLGTVFLAEIADKTMLATISYAVETGRYLLVLLVSVLAFVAANILSVSAGYLLGFYVDRVLLGIAGGLIFVAMGLLMLASGEDKSVKQGRSTLAYFTAMLVCEMGDKTQLAMFSSSAMYGQPVITLIGGALGYALSNTLGILVIASLGRVLSLSRLKKGAALLMVAAGVLAVLTYALELIAR